MKKNVKRKPSATNKRSSQKRGKTKPSYGLWGSVAAVCLLLVGGIWYASTETAFHTLLARFQGNTTSSKISHKSNTAKKAAVAENDSSSEPEFDFYQILPNTKVETTIQNTKEIDKTTVQNTTPILQESPEGAPIENMTSPVTTAENPPSAAEKETSKPVKNVSANSNSPKAITATTPKKEYYLQIISLTNLKEADNYKAKLILDGYSPFMTKAYIRGNTWYRILVGPYDSSKEITLVKAELAKDHYKTLLIVDSEGKIHE